MNPPFKMSIECSLYRARAIDEYLINHPFTSRADAEKVIDAEVIQIVGEVNTVRYVCPTKTCRFLGRNKADLNFHQSKFKHGVN